jgi:hypothetical protein
MLAALLLFASSAAAQSTKTKIMEEGLSFQTNAIPWNALFKWLSERTGMPVNTQGKTPAGTLNIVSPKGTKYKLPQIIDLINENLLEQKLLLLRRHNSFILVSSDKKLPPALVPRLSNVKELEKWGQTEVVSLKLKPRVVVNDVAAELKKLQGPFGDMVILTQANQIILQDTVENIARILKHIENIEETVTSRVENNFEVIQLRHANALVMAKILEDGFNGTKSILQASDQANRGRNEGNPLDMFFGKPKKGDGGDAKKVRVHIIPDTSGNRLLIKADPPDMAAIRLLIRDHLDLRDDSSEVLIKTFVIGPLKHTNADDVGDVIKDVFRESMNANPRRGVFGRNQKRGIDPNGNPKGVLLSLAVDDRTNSLVLSCSTAMKKEIDVLVKIMEKTAEEDTAVAGTQVVEVVQVKGVDPKLLQQALDAIQGRRPTTGGGMGGMNTPWGFNNFGGRPGGFGGPGGPGGFRPRQR